MRLCKQVLLAGESSWAGCVLGFPVAFQPPRKSRAVQTIAASSLSPHAERHSRGGNQTYVYSHLLCPPQPAHPPISATHIIHLDQPPNRRPAHSVWRTSSPRLTSLPLPLPFPFSLTHSLHLSKCNLKVPEWSISGLLLTHFCHRDILHGTLPGLLLSPGDFPSLFYSHSTPHICKSCTTKYHQEKLVLKARYLQISSNIIIYHLLQ